MPASAAISSIGRSRAVCAISRLVGWADFTGRRLMSRDRTGMTFVCAGAHDLVDLVDDVAQLVVGVEVVRADTDARAGAEVAQDLPVRELGVDGREFRHVDGD